ncbi:hypothetical protein FQA39_LY17827 [Lamprigera yunnana]|nr:hypothetical protein FQA39_LY17827 [Lamprigera yunnana]
MSDVILEESLLNSYNATVKCLEELQLHFQLSQVVFDPKLIENCYNKIQMLLHMEELYKNTVEATDLNHEIHISLLFIREHLVQLMGKSQQQIAQSEHCLNTCSNENVEQNVIESITPRVKGLKEIVGLVEVKKILITIIILPIRQPQLYNNRICNSVLLYGPPGTGKTRLVHAIAAEASAKLFNVSAGDILSQYVGNSEKFIKNLFSSVKKEQCCSIVFIDEIDGLCQRRQTSDNEFGRRVKTELMTQISNFEDCQHKYLICATNCPWDLDCAIIRRFNRRIYVPLPSREERIELLKYLTKDNPILTDTQLLQSILNKTENYSPADLTDLIRNASNIPATEILDANYWEHVGNNQYKAVSSYENIQNLVFNSFMEMPPGSIQLRPYNTWDIIKALESVKPALPNSEVYKYEEFCNKH